MESTDLTLTERRARRAYETSRLWRAALAFAPVLVIVAGSALLGEHIGYTLACGAVLFAVGVALLWYGRDVRRAVLPGVLAGLVPLVFALCAKHMDHACMGDVCWNVCVPACALGGFIAGIVVTLVRGQRRSGIAFGWVASAVTILTGALGCSCAGVLGVGGLVVGFAASTGIGLLVVRARRSEPTR